VHLSFQSLTGYRTSVVAHTLVSRLAVLWCCGARSVLLGLAPLQPVCHADQVPMASVCPVRARRNVWRLWGGSPTGRPVASEGESPEHAPCRDDTALFLGAGRGIGPAIARGPARRGARVVLDGGRLFSGRRDVGSEELLS
jgi:hypothetical protein